MAKKYQATGANNQMMMAMSAKSGTVIQNA
jgi:hypothetical protein